MTIPSSTYRIQLHKNFSLKQLKEIIDYLQQLGVGAIYASPVTTAIPGSVHGYDVTDPAMMNPEIGTEKDWQEINEMLVAANIRWVQDIVPNHMAFHKNNNWLMDVLERGSASPFYTFFDIDFNHPDPVLNGKLMAPFLGKKPEECLQSRELKLVFTESGLGFQYYDNYFPLSFTSCQYLFTTQPNVPSIIEFELNRLSEQIDSSFEKWQQNKNIFLNIIKEDVAAGSYLQDMLTTVNKQCELLKKLLTHQHYILTNWQLSNKKINYRRFFTVNSLICLCMEKEDVFGACHQWLYKMYKAQLIQGLRIDHIDGLVDPQQYIASLRKLFGKDCYIVVEKILQADEKLPSGWDCQGTTGYDFLAMVGQLLTDHAGAEKLVNFYQEFTGITKNYGDIVFEKKLSFLQTYMQGELDNLVQLIKDALLTSEDIKDSLAIWLAAFPLYRLYPEKLPLKDEEQKWLEISFELSKQKGIAENDLQSFKNLFDKDEDHHVNDKKLRIVKRLMQFTGPLAAKGVEDTTFYVYNPVVAHNEVGDSPENTGMNIRKFHDKMIYRQTHLPSSMNTTSTHDTKRGEDARIRLNLLSAMPREWETAITNWHEINKAAAPDINDEYFIYQSLLAGFPADMQADNDFRERFSHYIIKAIREAKVHTNWEKPDEVYEKRTTDFIYTLFSSADFLNKFKPFAEKIIRNSFPYSLTQVLVKLAAPGIPDIYQGCELWDLSYVDPDNRRPVAYEERIELLKNFSENEHDRLSLLQKINDENDKGAQKIFLTQQLLLCRKQHASLFAEGNYIPLFSQPDEEIIIAFLRQRRDEQILVAAPLLNAKTLRIFHQQDSWQNYSLALPDKSPERWINIFTKEMIEIKNKISPDILFDHFPVCVLKATK